MALNIKYDKPLNVELKHKGFPYQLEAFDALKDLTYAGVFHEQGLGKTKIVIDIFLHWLIADYVDSVIIIVKKSLIKNWYDELSKHTYLKPRILDSNIKNIYYSFNSPIPVYLTHYELIKTNIKAFSLFLKTRNVGAILDEAHKIKNPDSALAKSLLTLSPGFKRKIILTGTPVANRPFDIWSIIYFLDQGESLGKDFKEFKVNLDLPKENDEKEGIKEFEDSIDSVFNKISKFSIRETKDGSKLNLPEKIINNLLCDWETIQYEKYIQIRDELKLVILRDGIPVVDKSDNLLKRLLRLVQIASNPAVLDKSYSNEPGKFKKLMEILEEIITTDNKVIIWTSFNDNSIWLRNNLREYNPVLINGKINIEDRNTSIDKFKNNIENKILVATPGAAKEGFTLTEANHAIFYDRSFSLSDYLQSQDRIHRISQNKICYIYNLIMNDSIDLWIESLLNMKRLAAQLTQGDITKKEYTANATYSYIELIKEILNINTESKDE